MTPDELMLSRLIRIGICINDFTAVAAMVRGVLSSPGDVEDRNHIDAVIETRARLLRAALDEFLTSRGES